jgi:hypothetical protein
MNALARFAVASTFAVACLEAPGWAQTATPGTPPAARAQQPAGLNGLTSGRGGRVAASALRPNDGAIVAGAVPADSAELSVAAASTRALTPKAEGRIDLRILDRETTARFAALDHCRVDVARRRRISPARVTADALTLRWTILGKGQVSFVEVVGSTPTDADVLDCVKRDAKNWRFTAPFRGDVRLQRAFVFRPLSPDPPAR